MADDDDDGFTFGDFKFAPPSPQPQPQPFHINGGLTSSSSPHNNLDDLWGDFSFAAPQPQQPSSLSNGFFLSPHQQPPPNPPNPKPDPTLTGPSIGLNKFEKPRGALPLSLFGEVEDEEEEKSGSIDDNIDENNGKPNGGFDPKPAAQNGNRTNGDFSGKLDVERQQINPSVGSVSVGDISDGKTPVSSVSNGDLFKINDDLFGKLDFHDQQTKAGNGSASLDNSRENYGELNGWFDLKSPAQNGKINGDLFGNLDFGKQPIKPGNGTSLNLNGSGFDLNNVEDDGNGYDEDEWEFKGAFDGNGVAEGNLWGGSSLFQAKEEPVVMMSPEKQAGQDASVVVERKPSSSSSLPQFVDLFAAQNESVHLPKDMGEGFTFDSSTSISNGVVPDLFQGFEEVGMGSGTNASSGNGDADFDDFGDFVDASQEVHPSKQDQVELHKTAADAQSSDGKLQVMHTQSENSRGALPLSLFSDETGEPSDYSDDQNEFIDQSASYTKNGFSAQGPGLSIHDLISNLYSQAPENSSVDFSKTPPANGVQLSSENIDSNLPVEDDDWDDGSWDFKAATSGTGATEQPSVPYTVNVSFSETSSSLKSHIDFYHNLRDTLCFLLSYQLEEEKKAQRSAASGDVGEEEIISEDIKEAYKLLEHTQEVPSEKYRGKSSCLDEVLKALQEPRLNAVESEYALSKRLQSAVDDWRITAELLRHAMSVLQILSLGSAEEQFVYITTWSKIINFCSQELKHGALIWKKASEKDVQHQLLSDSRGQQYFQALGEIYKVVELLALSAKIYKPWMLLRTSEQRQFFGLLDECGAVWSSSGLKEVLQKLSDNVDYGFDEAAKALVTIVETVRNLDVLTAHDRVFIQHKSASACQLSLLPQEMLPDLKTAEWNGRPFFVNLANLWANLVSREPPQLPHLQVR